MNAIETAAIPEDMMSLSAPVRWHRALRALRRTIEHPEETEQALIFFGYANAGTIARRMATAEANAAWTTLYTERRAIDSTTIDLDALAALPANTLGHAYAHFLRSHGITPEIFDGKPPGVTDERTAYAIQRLRQTHDLWHVVTNHETDVVGEIALQAFSYAQVDSPASLLVAVIGTLKGWREVPGLASGTLDAYRTGKRAKQLATFPWEDHWATPLAEVRRMLNVTPVADRARIELPLAA